MNTTLTKTLLQFTEFCSSVFVIDFEQVNDPREVFNVIIMQHLVSNKNTRKKCEICLGGNYSEKNLWGDSMEGHFQRGGYCPEGNYLGVIVWG